MSSVTMMSRKFSAAAPTAISTSCGPGGAAGTERIASPLICPAGAVAPVPGGDQRPDELQEPGDQARAGRVVAGLVAGARVVAEEVDGAQSAHFLLHWFRPQPRRVEGLPGDPGRPRHPPSPRV